LLQALAIVSCHRLVRRHLDQRVREPKGVGTDTLDQPLPFKRLEVSVQERARLGGEERLHDADFDIDPGNRGHAQHVSLARSQAVETHRQQAGERGGDGIQVTVVKRRDKLLGEERYTVRESDDPSQRSIRERARALDRQPGDVAGL
jgi:hypothetical protein